MLEEVRITGLGVIDDAVLELSAGFTVLTGETGAGKTMVVTALGLMFGGRADPARVRPGAARASVEGRLLVSSKVAREAMAGLAIGVTLVFVHLVGIALTGTGVNPARSIGPALFVGCLSYVTAAEWRRLAGRLGRLVRPARPDRLPEAVPDNPVEVGART